MSIAPIRPIQWPRLPEINRASAGTPQADFAQAMSDAIGTVGQIGQQAAQSTERFLNGEGEEIHSVIMAQQRSAVAFDLFLQVRNKVVNAYQEVMRMQV